MMRIFIFESEKKLREKLFELEECYTIRDIKLSVVLDKNDNAQYHFMVLCK